MPISAGSAALWPQLLAAHALPHEARQLLEGHERSAGLTKLLPAGQAEVMRECWARGPLNVRAVYTTIAARRAVAYTTIMTTCARLAEKGLLRREKAGSGYVYTPTISERAYVRREIAGILDSLARDYPTVLSHELDTRREHAAN